MQAIKSDANKYKQLAFVQVCTGFGGIPFENKSLTSDEYWRNPIIAEQEAALSSGVGKKQVKENTEAELGPLLKMIDRFNKR